LAWEHFHLRLAAVGLLVACGMQLSRAHLIILFVGIHQASGIDPCSFSSLLVAATAL